MIFDNNYITDLVIQWKRTHDDKILELIIEHSRSLIEVMVSYYDPIYREDLIQESALRLQYALDFADPSISSMHNYFTTVIKNICLTYLRKQNKYANEYQIDLHIVGGLITKEANTDDILTDLIHRNRVRFPSLSVDIIDDITEHVYSCLLADYKRKDIVADLTIMYDCTRNMAIAIYYSVLIYLRAKFKEFAIIDVELVDREFSIIPDLEELFGDKIADVLSKALTGLYIKFP